MSHKLPNITLLPEGPDATLHVSLTDSAIGYDIHGTMPEVVKCKKLIDEIVTHHLVEMNHEILTVVSTCRPGRAVVPA